LVAVTAVVSARDKYGDRLLAELRVEREPVAVDVPPDGVLTVVGRRDALLVLVAAAKLWVDHIHERVIRQPRAVYTEREVLVEAAPLAEGTMEAADLIDDLAGEVQHRSPRQVEHAVPIVAADLADRPVVGSVLELVLEVRYRRHGVGQPPVARGGVAVVVKQEEVLNAALVQKLDALVLRGGSPSVILEAVKLPAVRDGDRLRGAVVHHHADRALREARLHLGEGLGQHLRTPEGCHGDAD